MAGSGPRRFDAGALAAALLLVLAGCGGVAAPDGTPTRAVTPAPVPTDRPTDPPLPPGVSPAGLTDAERLEAAHLAALSNATFVERARTTVRLANGSLAIGETYVGRHGPDATSIRLRRNGTADYGVPDRSLVEAGVWGNGSVGVRRFVTASGRVELGAFEGTGLFYRRPRGGYGLALREAETSTRPRRVANGSVEYVVVAEGLDPRGPWYFRRTFMRLRGDGRARVVVTPDGAIRRFVVRFPVDVAGRNATLRHVYTVERGADVTVARPTWFERAITGRPPGPRSLSPGGQVESSPPGARRITSGDTVGA